jgi:hypothetical protein
MIAPNPPTDDPGDVSVRVLRFAGLFPLGQVVATPGALESLHPEDLLAALGRHCRGEWGESLCDEDRQANDHALRAGGRLFSVYHDRKQTKFYIITECDRSATTILLPDEY